MVYYFSKLWNNNQIIIPESLSKKPNYSMIPALAFDFFKAFERDYFEFEDTIGSIVIWDAAAKPTGHSYAAGWLLPYPFQGEDIHCHKINADQIGFIDLTLNKATGFRSISVKDKNGHHVYSKQVDSDGRCYEHRW